MSFAKILYFGDFVVIPLYVVCFAYAGFSTMGVSAAPSWATALGLGLFAWTFIEYLVHRFVYHSWPFFTRLHHEHHDSPKALLGFPAFVSSSILLLAFWTPLRPFGPAISGGFVSGVLLGYVAYIAVHHATHHVAAKPGTFFYGLWLRHMAHHYREEGNFGVTTGLWDRIFGTEIERKGRAARA